MADHTNLVLFWLIEAVLAVIIIIANGMTIIVLSLSRRLSRGYSNHLVLNLSIADLCTGFAYLYVSLTNFTVLANNPMNKYACLLRMSSYYCAIAASFYATLAIAINRYVAIVYPLKYTKYVARRMVNAMIVVSWCAAVLISSVPLYWNNFDPEKGNCKNIISNIHQTFFLLETVLAVIIIISNGMTIIVQSLNRRLFDGVYNQLILNLTIADLFTGFAYLYMIATFLWGNFSKFACLLGCWLFYIIEHANVAQVEGGLGSSCSM
ncbi:glucose-dependent insulinotropic receptor-like [Copidosoma floridanum]|uniref:glucose-dependent insulinotropic receptor-like n=1 Tax=Copidosoma floridanum TaxID=29053 RepID=UPI0006C9AD8E|nr:glucose-dependent insulinotropic receptor-like [Copidosoma floridanum]